MHSFASFSSARDWLVFSMVSCSCDSIEVLSKSCDSSSSIWTTKPSFSSCRNFNSLLAVSFSVEIVASSSSSTALELDVALTDSSSSVNFWTSRSFSLMSSATRSCEELSFSSTSNVSLFAFDMIDSFSFSRESIFEHLDSNSWTWFQRPSTCALASPRLWSKPEFSSESSLIFTSICNFCAWRSCKTESSWVIVWSCVSNSDLVDTNDEFSSLTWTISLVRLAALWAYEAMDLRSNWDSVLDSSSSASVVRWASSVSWSFSSSPSILDLTCPNWYSNSEWDFTISFISAWYASVIST